MTPGPGARDARGIGSRRSAAAAAGTPRTAPRRGGRGGADPRAARRGDVRGLRRRAAERLPSSTIPSTSPATPQPRPDARRRALVPAHPHGGNWHPLTSWSHMLDVQLFGLEPAGHHAVSLLLHVLNAVLLVLVLYRLTGAWWRSLLVARAVRAPPAAGRVGGVGLGAQGRAERALLRAHAGGLRPLGGAAGRRRATRC